jgi:hypothetical protein
MSGGTTTTPTARASDHPISGVSVEGSEIAGHLARRPQQSDHGPERGRTDRCPQFPRAVAP